MLNLLGPSNPLGQRRANYLVWGNVAGWTSSYYLVWGNTIQEPSGQYVVWGNNDDRRRLRRLGHATRRDTPGQPHGA